MGVPLKFKIEYGNFFPKSAIEPEVGKFIYKLIIDKNLSRILEFGTGVGVSALYIASALKEIKGKLYTYDKNEDFLLKASQNLSNNSLSDYVEFYHLDLSSVNWEKFYTLNYDLIFIDAKKSLYKEIFVNAVQHLHDKSFMLIDDIFIDKTKVLRDVVKRSVKEFRGFVKSFDGLSIEEFQLGDGLFLISKK